MDEEEARRTVVATMSRLNITETDLAAAPRATVVRRAPAPVHKTTLPQLSVSLGPSSPESETADLRVHGLAGRGGMGVVHVAAQASLQRDVAVKTVAKAGESLRLGLIREAQTVGRLEHPNIVPVHALGVREDGAPVLVMKLIDGVTWRTLLDDREHPLWATLTAGHRNPMRANAELLIQVARAIAFAHSKGIVHRDLKPDNVMIGRFGEVYVVDWGIALRLDERHLEPDAIVGTPAYLAPEMARGAVREIDERTDVYLLAALAFEVVTGRPPHQADSALASLASALMEVTVPAGLPADIAEMLRCCLSVDPAKRLPNAEAFRVAVARHLAMHAADVLVESADRLIARADALFAAEGADSDEAARALIEARFALRSVLDTYDGPRIRERHDACVRRLVERELAKANVGAARSIAREIVTPDPALERLIAEADAAG